MASDPLARLRNVVEGRVAELRSAGPRLSPLDCHSRMDAIRELAAINGLDGLERLARASAQRALLPGHRVALSSCLERLEEAYHCRSEADCTAMLAAVAVRLH